MKRCAGDKLIKCDLWMIATWWRNQNEDVSIGVIYKQVSRSVYNKASLDHIVSKK